MDVLLKKLDTNDWVRQMTKTVVFTHIPKTAGTSISKSVFLPNFDVEKYSGIRNISFRVKKVDLLIGHSPYGIHKYSIGIKKPKYFTVLRNPVSRCLSFYYNNLKWEKHRGYEDSKNMSEVKFYKIPRYQNDQTRRLAGLWAQKIGRIIDLNNTPIGNLVFLNAKRNLESKYEAFGLTSRFEETADYFAECLGVQRKEPEERYKSVPGRRREEDLADWEVERIRRHNSLDVRLYKYAKRKFEEKVGGGQAYE